jgi:hypothetical protein
MALPAIDSIEVRNSVRLSNEHLALLWNDWSRLSTVVPDLAEPVLKFIVDGDHPEVLQKLAATAGCGRALGLHGCVDWQTKGGDRKARLGFFKQPPATDGLFYHRLAQAYDAAATADRKPNRHRSASLPAWIDLMLAEAASNAEHTLGGISYRPNGPKVAFSAAVFEQMLIAGGEDPAILARLVFLNNPKDWHVRSQVQQIVGLAGFNETALHHAAVVSEGLNHADADTRIAVLGLMLSEKIDPSFFAEQIVDLAISSAKTVRKAAEPLLDAMAGQATELLRKKAEGGSNEERLLAVQLLWRRNGDSERAYLTGRMQEDKSAKIKASIGELLTEAKAIEQSEEACLELPPVAPVQADLPLASDARVAFVEMIRKAWDAANQHAVKHPKYAKQPVPLADNEIERRVEAIERGRVSNIDPGLASYAQWYNDSALRFVVRPDVNLIHVVRLAAMLGAQNHLYFESQLQLLVSKYYHTHTPRPSLRDLAAHLQAIGFGIEPILNQSLERGYRGSGAFLNFAADDVWPFFAEHGELLEAAWNTKGQYSFQDEGRKKAIFKVLAMFPKLPPRFIRLCWDIAFNGNRKDRPLAQSALDREPGKEERILTALGGGKAEHRAIAAEWLGKIEYKPGIPALKKALAKEKQDAAAGQMMVALERLGVPLEEFVSTDGLLKEARTLLDKGIPEALKWLDLDRLPKVRWAATGKPVRKEILQWMVVQSYKLGSPDPSPRLRKYTSYFDRTEAEDLGQYILESWIAQDTVPHTHDQAHAFAEKHSTMMAGYAARSPQYYKGTKEEWYRTAYNSKLAEPIGTAIGEKGVLAVAGACCGGRAAAPAERFLKTYYGYRVHQCKALIRMLSWIEHPSAIQVLLSISNRFRTAGIRKEAELCVTELAERKNWTIDELADRTIPTGGFEEGLQLVLDYGQRKFTAKLNSDFDVILSNEEGKVIKTLPAPRQDEDAEKAKAAKKKLSASKKEIDSVLKLQKERLYEGMCTQRTWSFADWSQFLNGHAIIRLYCQRLVWGVLEGGKVTQTFRPLDDGTLTDTNDEAVTILPEQKICLAHACKTPAETAKAWQQHLADYDVQPLFEQFGKASYQLPADKREQTTLEDFQGHLLEAFKLRGRLTKQGYTRGAAEDGGVFYQYNKRFASLQLTATIEFTGNGLPEQNRTVALTKMHFTKSSGEKDSPYGNQGEQLLLGEVPAVLLSECWNDYRLAAAEGTGFDADWENKGGY